MPLIITCSECKNKFPVDEYTRKIFYEVIKTKEQLKNILCNDCEKKKENKKLKDD